MDYLKTKLMLDNFFKYRKNKNWNNIKSINLPDKFF